MPVIVSVVPAPALGTMRSLSPTVTPRSDASSVPIDDVLGVEARDAGDDLLRQRDDLEVVLGVDAAHGDRARRLAAHRQHRAGRHRRDRGHVAHAADVRDDPLPLVDRAQALIGLLHDRGFGDVRRGAQRPGDLLRRQQDDVGLRAQDPVDHVRLLPGERGGHEDDHADADRDAEDDEDRLQPPLAQEAARGDPLERQPASHSRPRAPAGRA